MAPFLSLFQKTLALGVYPEITLKEAREKRDEARKLVQQSIDPVIQKKRDKISQKINEDNTFEKVAREWHATKTGTLSKKYAKEILVRLEQNIFP